MQTLLELYKLSDPNSLPGTWGVVLLARLLINGIARGDLSALEVEGGWVRLVGHNTMINLAQTGIASPRVVRTNHSCLQAILVPDSNDRLFRVEPGLSPSELDAIFHDFRLTAARGDDPHALLATMSTDLERAAVAHGIDFTPYRRRPVQLDRRTDHIGLY